MSTFVAGTNVTARNGGTHVAPGSHLWPQDRAPKQEDTVAVEMKKGDLAIWFSNIFHGAVSVITPGCWAGSLADRAPTAVSPMSPMQSASSTVFSPLWVAIS